MLSLALCRLIDTANETKIRVETFFYKLLMFSEKREREKWRVFKITPKRRMIEWGWRRGGREAAESV